MRRPVTLLASCALLLLSAGGVLWLAAPAAGWLADPRFTPLAGEPTPRTVLARPEFRVPARINDAGFRGGPLPGAKRAGVYRIVVLGDSFTWGYGVRERQAYPARLARRLNARTGGAPRVEVVNLGVPGAGPLDYLWHLEHTGLALDPDLVVVGLFANDVNDLYQLRRFGARSPLFALAELQQGGATERPWWKRAADATLPNLYVLASRAVRSVATPREARAEGVTVGGIGPDPVAMVAALGVRYGNREAIEGRYRALGADDRAALDRLLRGEPLGDDMRPVLLLAALVDPEAEADTVLLRSPERRAAWDDTAGVLARIVALARRHGAETVLVALPASEQVDRARWPVLESAGFRLYPAMLADTFAARFRPPSRRANAGFVDLLAAFRARRKRASTTSSTSTGMPAGRRSPPRAWPRRSRRASPAEPGAGDGHVIEIGCQTYSLRNHRRPRCSPARAGGVSRDRALDRHADHVGGLAAAARVRHAAEEIGLRIQGVLRRRLRARGARRRRGPARLRLRVRPRARDGPRDRRRRPAGGARRRRALPRDRDPLRDREPLVRRLRARRGLPSGARRDVAARRRDARHGHLAAAGQRPTAAHLLLGDRVFDVHLKDVVMAGRLERWVLRRPRMEPRTVGTGEADLQRFLTALAESGYTGAVAIEDERPELPPRAAGVAAGDEPHAAGRPRGAGGGARPSHDFASDLASRTWKLTPTSSSSRTCTRRRAIRRRASSASAWCATSPASCRST
jgi:sugar phosphate isomerase/epimerase/lysophospholipase L1-like esterase